MCAFRATRAIIHWAVTAGSYLPPSLPLSLSLPCIPGLCFVVPTVHSLASHGRPVCDHSLSKAVVVRGNCILNSEDI